MSGNQHYMPEEGVVLCTAQITEMMGNALQEQIENGRRVTCVVPDFNIRRGFKLNGNVFFLNQKNFGVTKQLEIGGSKNTPRGVNNYFVTKFFDGTDVRSDNPVKRCLDWFDEHNDGIVPLGTHEFFQNFEIVAISLIRHYWGFDKSQLPTNKEFVRKLEADLGMPGLYENPDYKVFAAKIGIASDTIDAFVADCKDSFGHICNFSGLVGVDGCTTDVVNLVVFHLQQLGFEGPFTPARIAEHFAVLADPRYASEIIASIAEHKSDGEPDDLSVSALIWAHKVRLFRVGDGPEPKLRITFQASPGLQDIITHLKESNLPEGLSLEVIVDPHAGDNEKKVRKAFVHRNFMQWMNSFLE
jgi:hypothetical protein